MDGNRFSLSQGGEDFGGGTGVDVADHGDQVWRESHVGEGGEKCCTWDTAKCVADIQPGKT